MVLDGKVEPLTSDDNESTILIDGYCAIGFPRPCENFSRYVMSNFALTLALRLLEIGDNRSRLEY